MNVNSVNSLLPSFLLPLNSTATNATNANSASSVQQQADVLGPTSQFLTQLQQLQTQNPQQFQAMLTEITGQLDEAAGTASANGNTAQANQLTVLANSFQNASTGGPLPTAQQLHQAGSSGSSSSSAYNAYQAANVSTQNESLAASIFGSITPISQQTAQSIWA